VKSALDAWWILSSIFSGGMLGLFLLGYFVRRATNLSAAVGMACGLLAIGWMSLSQLKDISVFGAYSSPLHNFLVIVVGTAVIFLVGFLACLPASVGMKK